jgi:hypothetical protein
MLEKIVAAFLANYLKAHIPKSLDEPLARDGWKATHAVIATR